MINLKAITVDLIRQSCQFITEGWDELKANEDRVGIKSILFLGFFYAVELFNYQIANIVLKVPLTVDINQPLSGLNVFYEDKDILFLYLHGGMFIGMVGFSYWSWKSPQKLTNIFNWSIIIHILGAAITAIAIGVLSRYNHERGDVLIHLVGIGRLIFGVGFSAGLGLAITLVVENFSRSIRTWVGTIIGILGFLGPTFAQVLENLLGNGIVLLALGVVASMLLRCWKAPEVSEMRISEGEKARSVSFYQLVRNPEMMKLFGACLFMGVSVQFFSDMVSWLPRVNNVWLNDWALSLRYSGFVVGTLLAGVMSKFSHGRKGVILKFILAQVAVVILVALAHTGYKHLGLSQEGKEYITGALYFFMGVSCGHWIITILQTAEQFSVQERPTMAILIPNFYRVGTIVIIALNYYYYLTVSFKELNNGLGLIGNLPGILFAFWILFVLASLAASFLLKDNFEGDAYQAAYMNELGYQGDDLPHVAGSRIRTKLIEEIGEEIWTSRDESPFLLAVNSTLHHHFRNARQLSNCYVLSTIFFAEDDRQLLEFAGFGVNGDQFDAQTCRRYGIGAEVGEHYSPIDHHTCVHELIRHKSAESLALWMTRQSALAGILVYFAGWREEVDQEHLEHFRTFDLSCIKLSADDLREFSPIIRPGMHINTREALLVRFYEKFGHTFDDAFVQLIYSHDNHRKTDEITRRWEEGIKKTLLMHRLDAASYGASQYYTYYINPYYGNENHYRITLILKTVIQLPSNILGQIRDLLAFIILHRSTKIYKYNSEQFFRDEDHSTRSMLRAVRRDLNEFQKWAVRTLEAVDKGLPISWKKLDSLQRSLLEAEYSVGRMYDLKVLNMALIRYYGEKADRAELKNKGLPEPENIDLYIMLNSIIRREKNNKISNQVPPQITVKAIKIAVYIMLSELIQNAIYYASKTNPVIAINWISNPESPGYYELHIKNNLEKEMSEADQETLRRMVNDKMYDTTGRLGISTIHKLLKFNLLSESGRTWGFKCNTSQNLIDLYLVIPIEDIEYQITQAHVPKNKNPRR